VVGRTTVGKSLMMIDVPLSDGSKLFLNIGRVQTPCGRVIQRSYSDMPASRYLALRGEPVDTTGLPSCKSLVKGRTLYGGGGVRPDITFPRPAPLPTWRLRSAERAIGNRWAGSYVSEKRSQLTDPSVLLEQSVADDVVASYLQRLRSEGIEVPPDADSAELRFTLLTLIAETRWGPAERLQVAARLDPEIKAALAEMPKARALLEMPTPAR
jgi:carboxyl-terminal processing protease